MTGFAPASLPSVAPPDPCKHVNYQLGMVLGVDDFQQEFAYLSGRDRWLVRDVIGYGVASGLRVTIETATDDRGPRVRVAPGTALTPSGQSICISPAQCAYLNEWLQAHRAEIEGMLSSPPESSPPELLSPPEGWTLALWVVACHRECPTDDVPIPGEPCRSDDELRKPSRLLDSFTVELRLEPPAQTEEQAVRDFAAWVRLIEFSDDLPGDVAAFIADVRDALALGGSPPEDEPAFGTPPPATLTIPRAAAAEYLTALSRFWVSELRARLRSTVPGAECGCGGGGPGELDAGADCLQLAELHVPLTVDALSGVLLVADEDAIVVDDRARPVLLHLRLQQELLMAAWADSAAAAAPPAPPATVPAAVVLGDGTVVAHQDGLEVKLLEKTLLHLAFATFDATAHYVVSGQPVAAFADAAASTFEVIASDDPDLAAALGGAPDPGIVVRVRRADGDPVEGGFGVRIEQVGGGS